MTINYEIVFSVPLYELFQVKTETYFYTVSLSEINDAVKNRGFIRNNITALVATSRTDCKKGNSLVPVQRYFNSECSDYLYQLQTDEVHGGNKEEYSSEGIVFYGAATQKQCDATLPLYRFWNGKHHIYTTDLVDGKTRAGPNGINEGIICYIWPAPNTSAPPTPTTTTTTSTTTTTTTTTTVNIFTFLWHVNATQQIIYFVSSYNFREILLTIPEVVQ